MKILHINFSESKGGAARVMQSLQHLALNPDIQSDFLVSRPSKVGKNDIGINFFGSNLIYRIIHKLRVWLNRFTRDTVGFASKRILLKVLNVKPDIIHIHNIHGGWFDLNLVQTLARRFPIVWTLHDEWIYTGHCTNTFACLNFTSGCRICPNLSYEHKIYLDNASQNWQTRAQILKNISKLNVTLVCVSDWQRNRLISTHTSLPESTVIYSGVDSSIFRKRDTTSLSKRLGIPKGAPVILTSAVGGVGNKTKNLSKVLEVVEYLNECLSFEVYLLLVGGKISSKKLPSYIIETGYIQDQIQLSEFYSLADLMVYTTFNDTFGLTVVESLFCETPVIASNIGGIPEILPDKFLFENHIASCDLAAMIIANLAPNRYTDEWEFIFGTTKRKFDLSKALSTYKALYQKKNHESKTAEN